MYKLIDKKCPVRKLYTEQLIDRGDISIEDAEAAVNRFRERLEEVFSNVRDPDIPICFCKNDGSCSGSSRKYRSEENGIEKSKITMAKQALITGGTKGIPNRTKSVF